MTKETFDSQQDLKAELDRLRKVDEDFTDAVIEGARLRAALEQVVYKARGLPTCEAEQLILLVCRQALNEAAPQGMQELIRMIQNENLDQPKPRLVIVLNGGCVVNVYAEHPHEVEIMDCDSLREELETAHALQQVKSIVTSGLKEIY